MKYQIQQLRNGRYVPVRVMADGKIPLANQQITIESAKICIRDFDADLRGNEVVNTFDFDPLVDPIFDPTDP